MTEPLFPPPATPPGRAGRLRAAAERHVDALRRLDLVRGQHEVAVELVLFLAEAAGTARAYTLPAITKELREAIAALPAPEGDDLFDDLRRHLEAAAAEALEADQ